MLLVLFLFGHETGKSVIRSSPMGAILRFALTFGFVDWVIFPPLLMPLLRGEYYILLYLSRLRAHSIFPTIDSLVNLTERYHVEGDRAILFRS